MRLPIDMIEIDAQAEATFMIAVPDLAIIRLRLSANDIAGKGMCPDSAALDRERTIPLPVPFASRSGTSPKPATIWKFVHKGHEPGDIGLVMLNLHWTDSPPVLISGWRYPYPFPLLLRRSVDETAWHGRLCGQH